jgi:hypothetical protein
MIFLTRSNDENGTPSNITQIRGLAGSTGGFADGVLGLVFLLVLLLISKIRFWFFMSLKQVNDLESIGFIYPESNHKNSQ